MKKERFQKRFKLKKSTVVHLDWHQMRRIRGGCISTILSFWNCDEGKNVTDDAGVSGSE